jgi:hypothetical protein
LPKFVPLQVSPLQHGMLTSQESPALPQRTHLPLSLHTSVPDGSVVQQSEVCVQLLPRWQVGWPLSQKSPFGTGALHAPQFFGSVVRSAHVWPHSVGVEGGHDGAPPLHV